MKRLSTDNWATPAAIRTSAATATAPTVPDRSTANRLKPATKPAERGCPPLGRPLGNSMSTAGNKVKAISSANSTPMHIIRPKSSTGTMRLAVNDPKAAMVVSAVYRQGENLLVMVAATSSRTLSAPCAWVNSR